MNSYKNTEFWSFFDKLVAPRLGLRQITLRKTFEYLDSLSGPILIVETRCARMADNWEGDGQSTLLFDKYITLRDEESICYTVDISSDSVDACRKLVSSRVHVTQDDSVHHLVALSNELQKINVPISLLYLDSFDLDMANWQPSAIHHIKELCAIMKSINHQTLVVVDDCPLNANFTPAPNGQFNLLGDPSIGGKGRIVAEFAKAVGAKLEFAEYQAGWTGF
jgi:hypothetical protein